MMDIFRVARASDVDAVFDLSSQAGLGLSTVPKTRKDVQRYIASTEHFIAGKRNANSVLFVLESKGIVVGMSGVIVQTNAECPFLSFERKNMELNNIGGKYSHSDNEVLKLSSRFCGYSELGTLLLSAKSRGQGLGRLLSLGRLAFINSHKQSFADNLMADIRGWHSHNGISPFWSGFSSKYFNVTFEQAEKLATGDPDFLSNALPLNPVDIKLLEESVRSSIGKANDRSVGAVKLLGSAGFLETNFCNVLDGGPALECPTSDTVVALTESVANSFSAKTHGEPVLLYSGSGYDFRAMISCADIENAIIPNHTKLNFPDFENSPIKFSRLSFPPKFQNNQILKQRVTLP